MVSVERAKLEEASKQFEQAQAQRDEYLLLAKKVQAEFDNYRKRNATLRVDAEDEAVRQCVLAMLPTLDNLERALGAAQEESPLKAGVELTLRGMREALAKLGMEGVPCERGSVFDPEMYNAVMTCEASEDCPPGRWRRCFRRATRCAARSFATPWSRWPNKEARFARRRTDKKTHSY